MGSFNNQNPSDLDRLLMGGKALGESFSLTSHSGFLSARASETVASTSGGVVQSTGASGSGTIANTASNLTEFTKRKNWSQRIIEEIKDFLHVISPQGKLMYCSPSSQELVGYSPEELVGRNITDFIHVDDVDMFARDFNLAIQQRSNFKLYYRFRKKDDKFIIMEVNGHPYFGDHNPTVNSTCRCFFSMGRAYPSKTTAMLDSFLELKVENENLRRQLRDLMGPSEAPTAEVSTSGNVAPLPVGSSVPVERIEDIINDTTNPLEMLTGLRYQEDVDLGATLATTATPTLRDEKTISGNVTGVGGTGEPRIGSDPTSQPSSSNTAPRPRKKKKPKVEEEEYVCTDCGTVESPEWRKGPLGPKTLCNACGLRWAKKAKRQAIGTSIGGNGMPPPGIDASSADI
ncbi:hypothetical protein G9A89_013711 [Geosiphon pyriformis]|nr:hypothetical protein G9A89_013711 [Geosiphon pyriformis]